MYKNELWCEKLDENVHSETTFFLKIMKFPLISSYPNILFIFFKMAITRNYIYDYSWN